MSEAPTARAQPFYCPYCGETDLAPGEAAGEWDCGTCTRRFALRYLRTGGAA